MSLTTNTEPIEIELETAVPDEGSPNEGSVLDAQPDRDEPESSTSPSQCAIAENNDSTRSPWKWNEIFVSIIGVLAVVMAVIDFTIEQTKAPERPLPTEEEEYDSCSGNK